MLTARRQRFWPPPFQIVNTSLPELAATWGSRKQLPPSRSSRFSEKGLWVAACQSPQKESFLALRQQQDERILNATTPTAPSPTTSCIENPVAPFGWACLNRSGAQIRRRGREVLSTIALPGNSCSSVIPKGPCLPIVPVRLSEACRTLSTVANSRINRTSRECQASRGCFRSNSEEPVVAAASNSHHLGRPWAGNNRTATYRPRYTQSASVESCPTASSTPRHMRKPKLRSVKGSTSAHSPNVSTQAVGVSPLAGKSAVTMLPLGYGGVRSLVSASAAASSPPRFDSLKGAGFSSAGGSETSTQTERPPPPAGGDRGSPFFSAGKTSESDQQVPTALRELKPVQVVGYLDQHIVGQMEAKRAVASALRNRWRRQRIHNAELREVVLPKNILMIGPTGCGKTEIARKMAKILDAPFIKVEATKYTEVGFHGRDVDTIIKDLVEIAVRREQSRLEAGMQPAAQIAADRKVINAMIGLNGDVSDESFLQYLQKGDLDEQMVTVDIPSMADRPNGGGGMADLFYDQNNGDSPFSPSSPLGQSGGGRFSQDRNRSFAYPHRTEKKTIPVKEARAILAQAEFSKLVNQVTKAKVHQRALASVEEEGIVFLDEIDKICTSRYTPYRGPDASAEGVQRDLLPLIEGTTVSTRYGEVKTDYILFIASGAFHTVKPSDLMAELQGRLPVRVTLQSLKEEDFRKILTETKHNLLQQHIALLLSEGVSLDFDNSAIDEIARVACQANSFNENIGARRLVTVTEKVMGDISFAASELPKGSTVKITGEAVRDSVSSMLTATDLRRYVI